MLPLLIFFSDASPSGNNPTSAATITKRSSSNKQVNLTDSKQVNLVESEPVKKCEDNLPNREDYETLKTGRSPYFCVQCEKSFTRTSIR